MSIPLHIYVWGFMSIDVVTYTGAALPKTGTGKIQKLHLRAQYKNHKLPTAIQSSL
jgi:acyl-coenzyme A synthetase/AMP-(fatty) acid ligase